MSHVRKRFALLAAFALCASVYCLLAAHVALHRSDLLSSLWTPPDLNDDNLVLGIFKAVFVVSLPTRHDRRVLMESLRLALGIEWTYIDAIAIDHPLVGTISDCVRHSRAHAQSHQFQWPPSSELDELVHRPASSSNASSRWLPSSTSCYPPLANPASASPLPSSLGFPPSTPLTCAVQDHTNGIEYESLLPSYMLLTYPKLACWYSHLVAIQRFAEGSPAFDTTSPADAALFLEDDVDMEHDIHSRLEHVWSALPDSWDIVFLGHCWSDESRHPPLRSTSVHSMLSIRINLHPSFAPKCTHAYALSRTGARKLLFQLLYTPFAYSRALDQALAWLVQTGRVEAYSVVPSVVIQHKRLVSDIDGGADGRGSDWKAHLEHGIISGMMLSQNRTI